MNVFKTKDSKSQFIPINEENFKRATQEEEPYCVSAGKKRSYRAICPICDNPISIVGLYKREDSTKKPYGRHHKGTIPDLAVYDEERYLGCPFSDPNFTQDRKRNPSSETTHKLYKLMYDQFDRVIYIWNKTMPIWLSDAFALEQLALWVANKEWLNYAVTYFNLSYMLNYTGASIPLLCRLVKEDSELAACLSERAELRLIPSHRKGYLKVVKSGDDWVQLKFHLRKHQYKVVDESLQETVELYVALNGKVIYTEVVSVDHEFADSLFNKSGNSTYRNQRLLDEAHRIMDSKVL